MLDLKYHTVENLHRSKMEEIRVCFSFFVAMLIVPFRKQSGFQNSVIFYVVVFNLEKEIF